MAWKITGSVGRWEKDAQNERADVETVQKLLTEAARRLDDVRLDPKGVDGKIARPPATSGTIAALEAFQARFMANPDGIIDVGGRTWKKLVQTVEGASDGGNRPDAGDGPCFPFPRLPQADWTHSPRSFGANRKSKAGPRAHAGCDLYFPKGTAIYAVMDGKVTRGPYPFYCETFALEVDHGAFLARYGEVQADTLVNAGDRVRAGQKIARVGHLVGIQVPSDMLHLEMYDKSASGPLTVTDASKSKKRADGVPFFRRADLIDPTPKLNKWKTNLPDAD